MGATIRYRGKHVVSLCYAGSSDLRNVSATSLISAVST